MHKIIQDHSAIDNSLVNWGRPLMTSRDFKQKLTLLPLRHTSLDPYLLQK